MGDIPQHFQGDWHLNIPPIAGERGAYYPFHLTATEFSAGVPGAQKTKPTYTGPSPASSAASSGSSSGSSTPAAKASINWKGATITWSLVVNSSTGKSDTTTYDMTVDNEAGTKMSGLFPPEAIARAQLKGQAQVTAKELTQDEFDAKMKAIRAATLTATRSGMGTMETMLVVVLGLGVVWMLMNYKCR